MSQDPDDRERGPEGDYRIYRSGSGGSAGPRGRASTHAARAKQPPEASRLLPGVNQPGSGSGGNRPGSGSGGDGGSRPGRTPGPKSGRAASGTHDAASRDGPAISAAAVRRLAAVADRDLAGARRHPGAVAGGRSGPRSGSLGRRARLHPLPVAATGPDRSAARRERRRDRSAGRGDRTRAATTVEGGAAVVALELAPRAPVGRAGDRRVGAAVGGAVPDQRPEPRR